MPDNMQAWAGRIGAASRWHPEKAEETRRKMKFAAAKVYVNRLVNETPQLRESERAALAALLIAGGGDDDA